jgi:hypothetical protein
MPGPLGYPDWQRVNNYDSPVLFAQVTVVSAGTIITPVLDVSRYAYLGGADQAITNSAQALITWYADSAGTIQTGQRVFSIHASQGIAYYRLPNLGPYCTLAWLEFGGVHFQHSCQMFGTNRFHPLEFIPSRAQLITQSNVPLAASASVNVWPVGYYAGPVQIWINGPASGWLYVLQSLDANAVAQFVDRAQPAASGDFRWNTVAPPGAWWVNVFNNTVTAGNYYLSVTQSTTGAL